VALGDKKTRKGHEKENGPQRQLQSDLPGHPLNMSITRQDTRKRKDGRTLRRTHERERDYALFMLEVLSCTRFQFLNIVRRMLFIPSVG
jgi:hypothetical protein